MSDSRDNIIVEKSERFADRIAKMYRYLSEKRQGDKDMLKQIVRSGTSVGANVSEGQYAQTKADFLTKMTIALKEANETLYWLELLHDSEYIDERTFKSIHTEADEITAILASIVKSTKENTEKYDNAKGIFLNP